MDAEEKKADIEEICTTIATLHEPDALIELCALGGDGIVSGYYDDHVALARAAKRLSDSGIYHHGSCTYCEALSR
jgi:hypothetical protein